ncbi:MAG: GGDEF domain-containing protein [Clostridium sp.]|nr:GGDEF domain-containing protein [Clostridium sp.]
MNDFLWTAENSGKLYRQGKGEIQEDKEILDHASADPLTGLLNQRAFKERAENDMEQCGNHAALLLLNLDDFKEINDRYGHSFGDRLLAEAARILKEETRMSDFAGRVSGDEFIIYLHGIRYRGYVKKIAKRLWRRMKRIHRFKEKNVRISCSIGIVIAPEDGTRYEDLADEACRRLYRVKEEGKDGFYIHG